MANAGWKKLKAALGDGFEVPEPAMRMPEMDLTRTMDMPEMDLSHPEDVEQTRPLVKGSNFKVPAEMRFPPMDPTAPDKVMEMPEMDLRPNVVNAGSRDVTQQELDAKEVPSDEQALAQMAEIPQTETLVARPGPMGSRGQLISPDDPTASQNDPQLTTLAIGTSRTHPSSSPSLKPDRTAVKQLLAKAKGKAPVDDLPPAKPNLNPGLSEADINTTGPAEGPSFAEAFPAGPPPNPEDSTGFAAVRRPVVPRPGSIPAQVGAAITGATPPAAPLALSELEVAQRRARMADREAQYANGMGRAADIISGTRLNDHAGEDIRAAGQQGVKDVLDREAQGLRAAGEQRAQEDQTFQRQGEQRAQGADERTRTNFDIAQDQDRPGTERAKRLENAVRALYPKETKSMPPGQLSENQWKTMLGELQMSKALAAGRAGSGGKEEDKEVIQRAKMIPKNAKGIYDMLDGLDGVIADAGGADKIEGVGGFLGLGALRPGITLDPSSQRFRQLRQQISNMTSNQLFGSALSPTEAGRFDKAISDVATGNSMEQVMGGMRVVREMTKSAYDQAMAGTTPGARKRIEHDIGGLAKPLGPALAPKPKLVRLKNGEVVEVAD